MSDPSVFWAGAILMGLWRAMEDARVSGLDRARMYWLGLSAIAAGLVASRLMEIGLRGEWGSLGALWNGGRAWFGALGAAGAVFAFAGRAYAGAATPGVALGYAVGRIGCFLNGCEPGAETPGGWQHPAQLYASAGGLLLFLLLRRVPAHRRLVVFCAGYAALRFALEPFRRDFAAVVAGLSLAQIFCLVLLGVAALLWQSQRKRCPA